jgi:hypothetical protein
VYLSHALKRSDFPHSELSEDQPDCILDPLIRILLDAVTSIPG